MLFRSVSQSRYHRHKRQADIVKKNKPIIHISPPATPYSAPYSMFGEQFDIQKSQPAQLAELFKLIDREYILTTIFSINDPLNVQGFATDITMEVLPYDTIKNNPGLNIVDRTRSIYLNIFKKFYKLPKPGYVFFKDKTHSWCAICRQSYKCDDLTHLTSCLTVLSKKEPFMACHSCGVEKSSNFDEKEHLVSQSHYNSHFACLALNSDKKIVAGSSLTHKNVISPNFSAIVQALDGTLHANIPELANAWLEHTKKTYHNTFRETHTPHNAMLTLKDTIFEFGSIALPCTSCDNHLLRTSGIALNHYFKVLAQKFGMHLTQARCQCGNASILATAEFMKTYLDYLVGIAPDTMEVMEVSTPANVIEEKTKNLKKIPEAIKYTNKILATGSFFEKSDYSSLNTAIIMLFEHLHRVGKITALAIIRRVDNDDDVDVIGYYLAKTKTMDRHSAIIEMMLAENRAIFNAHRRYFDLTDDRSAMSEQMDVATYKKRKKTDDDDASSGKTVLSNK